MNLYNKRSCITELIELKSTNSYTYKCKKNIASNSHKSYNHYQYKVQEYSNHSMNMAITTAPPSNPADIEVLLAPELAS